MSLLAKAFRDEVSKSKDYGMKVEVEPNISYPTTFLSYDFRNGALIQAVDDKGKPCPYYSVGIQDGSMVMVIGRSGSGKTTWVVQSAGGIVKPFKTSCIFHDDIESGITNERKRMLSEMTPEQIESRYIHRNTGITAENFYERVRMIHDLKSKNRDEYEYDTKRFDELGNRIFKLEPTVYILDSLSLLMPEQYTQEEELSGQMSTTAAARANAMIFRRMVPMLKQSNIILFIINHINQAISINAFSHTPAQVSYLRQGETLPGGNTPIYLSNLIVRLDDQGKLTSDKTYGIDGSIVKVSMVKSRNNKAGQEVFLVFDQSRGFDRELSLLELLKQHKKLNGGGRWQYVGDLEDVKFSQREFKGLLKTEPRLVEEVHKQCFEILETYIFNNSGGMNTSEDADEAAEESTEKVVTVTDLLMSNVA